MKERETEKYFGESHKEERNQEKQAETNQNIKKPLFPTIFR